MRRLLSLAVLATLLSLQAETGFSQQPPQPAQPVIIQNGNVTFSATGQGGQPVQGTFQLAPSQPGQVMTFQNPQGQGGRGPGGGGPGGGGFGGGGGGPGGGRMGMMGGDPMQFFNMLSRGKDTINRNELDDWQQRIFDRMAPAMGITNGQMNRDQFRQAAEQMRSRMQNGGGGGFGGGGGGMGGGGGGFGAGMSPEQMDRFSEERFRRADINGDGLLQVNELSERLKPVWEKFDLNKDGAIDLNEYKSYMRTVFQQEQANAGQGGQSGMPQPMSIAPDAGQQIVPTEDDERKPMVYRAGKLPKDIPAWFEQLDIDKDGQLGLYEWIKGGKSIDEFRTMDRNDDGFLTIDEIMSFVHHGEKQPGSQGNAMAMGGGGGPGMFNGFGGGNFGGGNTRMFNAGNNGGESRSRGPGAWSGENGGGRMRGGPRGDGENGGFNRGGNRGGDNGNGNGGFGRGQRGNGGENGNGGFGRGPRGGDGNNGNGNGNFGRGPRGGDGANNNGNGGNNNGGGGNGRGPRGNYRYDPSDPTLP